MDIWGPLSIPSMIGYRYVIIVVNNKSIFTWLFLMILKSKTSSVIRSFVSMINTQFNIHIKCIKYDNGSVFIISDFYKQLGIIHQTFYFGTPQENDLVERKHQHILSITRALLFKAQLPQGFWAHVVGHFVHITNKFPIPFLKHKSPYPILYNKPPDLINFKVFVSLYYASTLKANKKLDSRSQKCIYLGYKFGIKGDILFYIHCKELFLLRDVIFFEFHFPYMHYSSTDHITCLQSNIYYSTCLDVLFCYPFTSTFPTMHNHNTSNHSTQSAFPLLQILYHLLKLRNFPLIHDLAQTPTMSFNLIINPPLLFKPTYL